ncbi:hypothetical protein RCH12_002188 [Cryobacterium sp. MP_3.1]|nr:MULTISPECIES: GAP family protein [Cryobacterium]MEC5184718.1 hypothetical protein [Cryobacterium sp. MP_3.1]
MGPVIGDLLPLALGIALSPIPVFIVILLLLTPTGSRAGLGFLAGWVVGILGLVSVFTLLFAVIPEQSGGEAPLVGALSIAVGVVLVLLAVREFGTRHKAGEEPELPGWMASLDRMTAGRGFAVALLFAAVKPKNLLLGASAGITIGAAHLDRGASAALVLLFTVLAASTVLIPVLTGLVAGERMRPPLQRLETWLITNYSVVVSVVLLVIGVVVIGNGLGRF